jgi:TnpA family transposase
LGGPFLFIPLFILAGKKRKQRLNDVEGNKLRRANKLAKKYLSEAKRNTSNPVAFYESLERALHNYLKAKLNIETSEMEKSLISKMLLERNVEASTVENFIGLLKSCEYARYASSSKVSVQQDYNKSVEVISNIDKQIQ